MIRYCLILLLSCSLINACNFKINNKQAEIISSSDTCTHTRRFLNPDAIANPSETDLDRYFRLAFNTEAEGQFEQAFTYYQKASEIAICECDQKHALAGKKAAQEANNLVNRYGVAIKPTQYFWGRLQELTKELPCVHIQQ